jgi:hypothetical protein
MSNRDEQKLAAAEARVKQQTTHSGVDEIRKLLNSLDIRITRLREETPEDALEMLSLFDQVTEKLERTQQLGTPLASEYSQFETILSRFLSQGALFIQKAGGQPVLEAIRQANPPKEERWWWRIDEVIANDRAVRIKRWLRTGLIAAVIIIIAAVIYQLFLAPDPTTRAIYSNSQSAEFNLLPRRPGFTYAQRRTRRSNGSIRSSKGRFRNSSNVVHKGRKFLYPTREPLSDDERWRARPGGCPNRQREKPRSGLCLPARRSSL